MNTAISQVRGHPAGRGYLERQRSEDRSQSEVLRCSKRWASHAILHRLRAGLARLDA